MKMVRLRMGFLGKDWRLTVRSYSPYLRTKHSLSFEAYSSCEERKMNRTENHQIEIFYSVI
jgi:hypothetical protein